MPSTDCLGSHRSTSETPRLLPLGFRDWCGPSGACSAGRLGPAQIPLAAVSTAADCSSQSARDWSCCRPCITGGPAQTPLKPWRQNCAAQSALQAGLAVSQLDPMATSSSAAPRLQGWVGGALLLFCGIFIHYLLTFGAAKVSCQRALPQMPRNVTQNWLFLDLD